MTTATFKITPTAAVAKALAACHSSTDSRGPRAKVSTVPITFDTPKTFAQMSVVLSKPGEKSADQNISFTCTVDLASVLHARNAYSNNMVAKALPLILALFKHYYKTTYPGVASAAASINADHCSLPGLTGRYYIDAGSEANAIQLLQKCLIHATVLSGADPHPSQPSSLKATGSIQMDSASRHAFTFDLQMDGEKFGRVRFSVAREPGEHPKTFSKKPELREKQRARSRQLVSVEVTVATGKLLYTAKGESFRLPDDYREWTEASLQFNPFSKIWEAFCYAFGLFGLAAREEEIDRENFDATALEILDAYLAGKDLSLSGYVDGDADLLTHRDILRAGNIDILIPWALSQTNLSGELAPIFNYEDRFIPADDELLASHSLSKVNIDQDIEALRVMLADASEDEFEGFTGVANG